MKYIRLLVILSVLLVQMSASVFGATANRPVTEISIVNAGPGTVDDASIRAYIASKTGKDLDRIRISRDVKALLDTGRFSDVKVSAYPDGQGIKLVYSLFNKWRLGEDIVINDVDKLNIRENKIRRLIDLNLGDLIDDQVLNMKTKDLRDEYVKDYYNDIDFVWKIEEQDQTNGTATVELTINEGKPAKVGRFDFSGNDEASTEDLRGLLKQRSKLDPRWLFRKRRYSPDDLEIERLKVKDYYLNKGFLDVVVDSPVVEKSEDGKLLITVNVTEGPLYRLGDISIEGISVFPEREIKRRMILKPGAVAAMSLIRGNGQIIRDYYGVAGYVDCFPRHIMDPDPDAGIVNVNIVVREGELTRIRNVLIRGNVTTKDKVIRRELLVYPGDKLNSVKADRSEKRLRNTGFFATVTRHQESTAVPGQKDVIFEVKEKPTGNMMLGMGFSSVDNLIGFAELQQSNFDLFGWPHPTGGGQKLRLSAQSSSTRRDYELSFTEPWFLDKKLSLKWDLYRKEHDYDDYDVKRVGSAIALTTPVPGYGNRVTFRYKLEDISDINDTNTYYMVDTGEPVVFDEEDRVDSSLRVTFLHDTRDNFFVPSRGTRATAFAALYGGPLGFDTEIYSLGFKMSHYVPLWMKHVLQLKLRYEVVEEYGKTDEVPWSERLFIGGGRTLRGFDYREVGPKAEREEEYESDEESDDGTSSYTVYKPYGGKSLAMGSVNYIIPIVKGLRLAFFYDIGNVWREPYEFDGNDLASSAGVGVRLDFPGFPIRIDRAWIIEKDHESTGEDDWVFWIGHDF